MNDEAHDLLVASRAEDGLPPTLEDDDACEQIAMLLNANGPDPKKTGAVPTTSRAGTRRSRRGRG